MKRNAKFKLGFALLVAFLLLVGIVYGTLRYLADRTPVTIRDLPLFPEATQMTYGSAGRIGTQTCPSLSLSSARSPFTVEEFYRQALQSNSWLGGGDTEYPDPLLFVRKFPNMFQEIQIKIVHQSVGVQVEVSLCNQP